MGYRKLQPPEGYTIATLDNGQFIVLLTPRNERGELINFGVLYDPEAKRRGLKLPKAFGRRTAAISFAVASELDELRAENRRLRRGGLAAYTATIGAPQPSNYATTPETLGDGSDLDSLLELEA